MADGVVLRSSLRMRLTGAACFGFPLFLSVLAVKGLGIKGNHEDQVLGIWMVVLLSLLFGYGGVLLAFANWRVDDEGLERLTPLAKRIRVPWSAITLLYEASSGNLVVRCRLAKAVVVPGGLKGINELRRLALAHAPASAFSELGRIALERRLGLRPDLPVVPVDAPEPVEVGRPEAIARWQGNPFFVLGLSAECSRAEVERAGQKLLALLAIGSGSAKRFATPVGEAERTAESVRAAMAELRDPERRLAHETWARLVPGASLLSSAAAAADHAGPWPEAMAAIGWRKP